ncbi:MAG: NADH-quinone oxidoreductase subunit M [Coriobacteriia bacterium]|nr:NADH-quinone oxidoreductase subunit M [Coriobacteriia bacterium]
MRAVLSLIIFLPLIGAVICTLLPKSRLTWPRWVAVGFSAADLALVAWVVAKFAPEGGRQFAESAVWVPQLNINYTLGVDGISITMLVLSALITFLAVIASWKVEKKPAFYFTMLLLLEVGMNGAFLALDFILFYLFWELVLVPMYFLIAQWGGPRRAYAALKFFLYTLFGSIFMLVGIVILYVHFGTFDMIRLVELGRTLPVDLQWWLFLLFFLGFAVKVPIWPLHTWLPDAHVEAPTAASAILAGVLLKMGLYGFLRVSLPVLPDAFMQWQWFLAVLAVISIIYGAAVAFAQTDIKKLVAYSSISHMGFAMLAIAAANVIGLDAALAISFSHGLISAMLFLMVGMIYDRAHTREIAELSGIAGKMPVIGGLLVFASIASVGVPGLSGFVGEFLALLGAWGSGLSYWFVIIALVGVLLGAIYMLSMVRRVAFGVPSIAIAEALDASKREIFTVAPLVVLIVLIGIDWNLLIRYVDPAARALMKLLEA